MSRLTLTIAGHEPVLMIIKMTITTKTRRTNESSSKDGTRDINHKTGTAHSPNPVKLKR